VSGRKPVKMSVHLTDRALQDLISIEDYSILTFGKRVANKYISDIEAALQRISDNPEILREEPNFHECLYFYRVNKHLLVCDVQAATIFVLTLLHANMDIPQRLNELEPALKLEVESLHQQLQRRTKKKH
jgi:toxin ParE1/3/4